MKPVIKMPKGLALPRTSSPRSKDQTWTWLTNVLSIQPERLKGVVRPPRKT